MDMALQSRRIWENLFWTKEHGSTLIAGRWMDSGFDDDGDGGDSLSAR